MSMSISCPQCRAALKLPDALPADRVVACPNCQLKFVPPVTAPTTGAAPTSPGSGGTALVILLMAVVLGAGGVIIAWNAFFGQGTNDSKNLQASSDKAQPSDEPAKDGVAPKKAGATPPGAPKTQTPVESKGPEPSPPSQSSKDDEIPDKPAPMSKKPPQKTYAETKRPQIEEPPVAAQAPMPPPLINVKPAVGAVAEHPRQKQINEAIEKGVAYLKKVQLDNGTWPKQAGFNVVQFSYDVGYASLAGLTLLECQVAPDDPVVQKAAAFVRSTHIDDGHRTYEMSCAILFLDRLGDPKDKKLIQSYALQLVAGQSQRAGWGYNVPELSGHELQQLLNFLEATRPAVADLGASVKKETQSKLDDPLKGPAEAGGALDPNDPKQANATQPGKSDNKKPAAKPKPAVPPFQSLSRNVAMIPLVYQYYNKGAMPPPGAAGPLALVTGGDDNSNSQFAMLALWAARRHAVPTELPLRGAAQRYRASQNADGGWSYPGPAAMGPVVVANIMGQSTPTMTCVGLLGLAMGHGVSAKPPAKLADDPAIDRGMRKLGEHINEMSNYYLLWSVERVGVLYQQKLIGGNDWYDTGVNMLLPSQSAEGSWSSQGYQGSTTALDTCFALLFLKRANLVQDLTERLPFMMSISEPGARPNR